MRRGEGCGETIAFGPVRLSVDTLRVAVLSAPVLSNYWPDLISLVDTERAYIVAVPRRVIFHFCPKMSKFRHSERRHFFASQWLEQGFLSAPVLSNYWPDLSLTDTFHVHLT